MLKLISSVVAVTTFITASLNGFIAIPKTMAASYRTTYKIYGDLNSDNKIDIFDVISMRKIVLKGDYDINLDFNRDDAVDSEDLDLLNDYVLGNNTFFDIYLNDDADEDQVCDIYEAVVYKSDPDSKDTDGDTLSDYEEVVYSNTSPTNKYTRGLSVTDADDDFDEDQLTNKEEMARKTEPLIADTDWDGLNDYDEINVYFTDPLVADTDGDGISDGSEIKLKLDPNKTATNGVSDGECIIQQTIDADSSVLSSINISKNPYELSIDIKTNGDAEKVLTVGKSSYSDVIANDAMLGDSIDIDLQDTSVLEKMVLRFNIDELRTYNTLNKFSSLDEFKGIKRLNIFKYDKEYGMLLPIDTEYDADNNQIYAEVDETGTYCIMDMEIWLDSFGAEMSDETNTSYTNGRKPAPPQITNNTAEYVPTYRLRPIDIRILLQNAGTDIEAFNKQKELIADFCDYVYSEYSNEDFCHDFSSEYSNKDFRIEFCVYGEDSHITYYEGKTYKDENGQSYGYYGNDWYKKALNDIEYTVTDDYIPNGFPISLLLGSTDSIFKGRPNLYIYSFRNGNTIDEGFDYEDYVRSNYFLLLDLAEQYHKSSPHNRFARFSEIGIPEWKYMIKNRDKDPFEAPSKIDEIKKRIESNEDLYLDTYDTSLNDLIEHFERTLCREPLYYLNLSTSGKQIKLAGELSPYNNIDTDGDGLTDWEEVDTSKLKINSDGSIEYPVFDIAELVRGLKRFKETGEYDPILDNWKGVIYLPIRSDPTKADSDGDGYTDDVELSQGTDPFSIDFVIRKDVYEYLTCYDFYEAGTFREKYMPDTIYACDAFLGDCFYAGKLDNFEYYKYAIIDYLDYAYDRQKTAYEMYELLEIEESTIRAFIENLDNLYTILEQSGKIDSSIEKDISLCDRLKSELQSILHAKEISYNPKFGTKEDYYSGMNYLDKIYTQTVEQVDGLKKTITLKSWLTESLSNFLEYAGLTYNVIDFSLSFMETYEKYKTFADTIERYELGIKTLDLLQDPLYSSDDTMRRAAGELKKYAIDSENGMANALLEATKEGERALNYDMINYALTMNPYTTWFALGINIGNMVYNYDEKYENKELLMAKSFIPDAITLEVQKNIKFNSTNNIAFSSGPLAKEKAQYLIVLIMARRDAENKFAELYESFSLAQRKINSENIDHAKGNVNLLDEYLDEYFIKYKPLVFDSKNQK